MSLLVDLDVIKHEGEDVLACRGCLATGVPLYSLHDRGLGQVFGDLTGFPVLPTDSYPQLLCTMCSFLIRKFLAFRSRCHSAMYTLQQMEMNSVKITTESLANVERTHIKPNLLYAEIQHISIDATSENSREDETKSSCEIEVPPIKTIEECMVNEIDLTDDKPKTFHIDLTEDDDKPLKHFVTAMMFGTEIEAAKIKDDDSGDDVMYDDVPADSDSDRSVKRRKVTRNSAIKPKRIKAEDSKRKIAKKIIKKKTIKDKPQPNMECEKTIKNKNSALKKELCKQGDKELLKTIANILRKIWQENKNSNIADIWELVYKQSLCIKDEDIDDVDCNSLEKNATTKQQIIRFIELTKKLAKVYNMEVKFLSVEDHRREIEDRRRSEKFANAPYRCEFCCKVYIFEDTFKRHMISHDLSSGDVECEICRYRFKNRKRYMNHFHIYHTKKIICKECGVVNRAWNFAKQHFKWHGGETTVCEQCGKHFPDKKLYCMHVRAVHRAELATTLCLLCGDTYNGDTGLRMHMDKAHRQNARCPSCGALFRSAEALAAHENNNCDPNGSPCPQCGENFPAQADMREHFDNEHNRDFVCEQCNKPLGNLVLYKRHTKRCLAPRDHERRRREERREKEKIKQTYNLNLMCELCGKGNFKCFSTLRSHQRVHTGERPFHCDICQKSFRELQFLKNHMKTHTDERRYKCPFCPKAFRQMGHRAAHILTHTKERPYACSTCTKRYTGLTALKEHINTAHRGLPPRQRGKNRDKQEL